MVSALAGLQCSMCCPSVRYSSSAELGRSQTIVAFVDFCKAFDSGADTIMSQHSEEDCQMDICHGDHTWLDKVFFLFNIPAVMLHGDTLSPCIFVVVVGYIMRLTVTEPSMGFRWLLLTLQVSTMLVTCNQMLSICWLPSRPRLKHWASRLIFEFMLAGDFPGQPVLHLGCWLKDSNCTSRCICCYSLRLSPDPHQLLVIFCRLRWIHYHLLQKVFVTTHCRPNWITVV